MLKKLHFSDCSLIARFSVLRSSRNVLYQNENEKYGFFTVLYDKYILLFTNRNLYKLITNKTYSMLYSSSQRVTLLTLSILQFLVYCLQCSNLKMIIARLIFFFLHSFTFLPTFFLLSYTIRLQIYIILIKNEMVKTNRTLNCYSSEYSYQNSMLFGLVKMFFLFRAIQAMKVFFTFPPIFFIYSCLSQSARLLHFLFRVQTDLCIFCKIFIL